METENKIDFGAIERKWQKKWEEEKVFEVKEDSNKKKYYVLEMYPYPSAGGLHIGHAFNYTIGDIYARYMIMRGYNVLHPMGFDSFGLPAENAAIKAKSHPKIFTEKAITNFIRQQKVLGLSYNWGRMLMSHDPTYYKWDQWIFLKMFEKGLAYKKKSSVNWCSKCNTVLANEQVSDGKCWRHTDTNVEIKHLDQWFFKITEYADELYEKIDSLDEWPSDVKAMQKNWIGKSQGVQINFKINGEDWPIFTTRPDTLYGVTFVVVSAQHPKLMELVTKEQKEEVEAFLRKIKSTSEKDAADLEKEGAFTGSYAVNPINGEKIPVWTGNFVVADYGAGMVMAVPAHDQRDFEFAKKYDLPIKVVIKTPDQDLHPEKMSKAFTGEGTLVNSGKFDGSMSRDAVSEISDYLEENKYGKKIVNYKLRDWLISRQRFWGTPIPVIYCDKCGIVPVPESDLPVILPEDIKFNDVKNPLLDNPKFLERTCPRCSGKGRRETDTMDTFVNSSWYFCRYCDPKNSKEIFSKGKVNYWMPIDLYIGGKEHACMHLIYSRFYTKFLRDLGLLDFDEPAIKLFNQGMVHGEDGAVMSKSRGNVVDPLDVSSKYGTDAVRMFLVSMASPDKDSAWSTTGIESIAKFVRRVYEKISSVQLGKSSVRQSHKVNLAIQEVTRSIENMQYNAAVIKLREFFDNFENEIDKNELGSILKLISPFCPHTAEELWERTGNKGFISLAEWPDVDESKIDEKIEQAEKARDKAVSDILNVLNLVKQKTGKEGNKVYIYVMPQELEGYNSESLSKRVQKEVQVFAVNDKAKYDPEGKASKAKPGKPGIYIE